MIDYTLAIGDRTPYGFSAADDRQAARHAAEYLIGRHLADWTARPALGVLLSGPNGLLNEPGEGIRAFCARIDPPLTLAAVDDIRPGDPVTPDCNGG